MYTAIFKTSKIKIKAKIKTHLLNLMLLSSKTKIFNQLMYIRWISWDN